MTAEGAGSIVGAEPAILAQPTSQLTQRAQFFMRVVGGTLEDLQRVPHVFTCDLAKVRAPHTCSTAHALAPS